MKQLLVTFFIFLLISCQAGTGEYLEEEVPITEGDLLSEIQQTIFTPICAQCHIGSQAPLGLNLATTEQAYQNLVNIPAVTNSSFDRVVPFEPEKSFLMLKILG